MSRTKDFMQDGIYYEDVKNYLFQIGAIETCPIHGNILIDRGLDEREMYARVTSAYKKDCSGDLQISYSAFHELVQDIMRDTFADCPECHHAME